MLERRTHLLPALALLPGLLALSGCDAAPTIGYVARDSAGIRVVDNANPAWTPDQAWRLGAPTVDLGGAGAEGPEAFRWVTTAFFSSTGELVVVEAAGDITFFDDGGGFIRTAGGGGDGPGEFRMVAGAGPADDGLWVYDYSHIRLTYLASDGALRSVHPLEGQDLPLMPVGRLGDGFLLAATYRPGAAAEARRLGIRRDTVDYLRFGPGGEAEGPLGRGAAREYVVGEEGGRLTMATPAFAHHADDATGSGIWVHGDESDRTLRVYGDDGALRAIIRWPGPELAVTDATFSREVERRVESSEEDAAATRRFLTGLEHPATRPAHGDVHVDPEGRIWVETAPGYRDDGRPFELPGWHVFDRDGQWLGTVPSPGRFRITQVLEDRVVGVWQDGLDVEHVQVRPLLRPGGGKG